MPDADVYVQRARREIRKLNEAPIRTTEEIGAALEHLTKVVDQVIKALENRS